MLTGLAWAVNKTWSAGTRQSPVDDTRRALQLLGRMTIGCLASLLLLFTPPAAAESLRILHTNDIHSHLLPFQSVEGDTVGGLARLATLIEAQRQDRPASLLLDGGDLFQGTPFFNFFHGTAEIRCLSAMAYDAMVLGNHELDEGAFNVWKQMHDHARFAFLCSNVLVKSWVKTDPIDMSDSSWVSLGRPFIMTRAGDLRIGLIGVTTEDLPKIVPAVRLENVRVQPIIETVRQLMPDVRMRSDLVIVLSHSGVAADSLLAATVPGIDVIVGGHTHTALHTPLLVGNPANDNGINGTLIVQAGQWGRFLGRLDLEVTDRKITSWQSSLLPVTSDLHEDRTVRTIVKLYADTLGPRVDEVLTESRTSMSSADVLRKETALGNLVTDLMRQSRPVDIAVQNGGGLRADLVAGPVRVRDIFTLLPFDNTLVEMTLDGRGILDLLEESVGRVGSGGFLSVSGLTFRVTSDGRVTDVTVGAKPLDPDASYRLVTNNFTASGGDGFNAFLRARKRVDTGILVRDAVIEKLRGSPPLLAPSLGRIRFSD